MVRHGGLERRLDADDGDVRKGGAQRADGRARSRVAGDNGGLDAAVIQPGDDVLRQAADLYEKGKQANVPGAGAALARVRSALASPPAAAAEGKKNPLRRLLDRLKGKS